MRDNIEVIKGNPPQILFYGESVGRRSIDFYACLWTEDDAVDGSWSFLKVEEDA
jgi:hypothetical protein